MTVIVVDVAVLPEVSEMVAVIVCVVAVKPVVPMVAENVPIKHVSPIPEVEPSTLIVTA